MDLKYSRKTNAFQSLRYRREKRDLKYSRKKRPSSHLGIEGRKWT